MKTALARNGFTAHLDGLVRNRIHLPTEYEDVDAAYLAYRSRRWDNFAAHVLFLYDEPSSAAILAKQPFTDVGAKIIMFPLPTVATGSSVKSVSESQSIEYPRALLVAFGASIVLLALAMLFGVLALLFSSKVWVGALALALILGGALWYGSLSWAEEFEDQGPAAI